MQVPLMIQAIPSAPRPQAGDQSASKMRKIEKLEKSHEITRVCPEPRTDSAVTISIPLTTRQRQRMRR